MLSDPIVALATPPGRSALAVVRVSGRGAFEVAARVVEGFRAERPRVSTLATFHSAGEPIDRGLYTVFPAPHSYTGEDMVELSCHGGQVAPARLLAALQAAGARPASPGEFTRRAVLNGKLDLVPLKRQMTVQDLLRHTSGIAYEHTGNGLVQFVAAPNNGPARTGSLTIAGRRYEVTQAAR